MKMILYDTPYKNTTYQIAIELNPLDVNELARNESYKYELMSRFLKGIDEFRDNLLNGRIR